MLSVKGVFHDGTAKPAEPIEGRDGQTVIITFLEDESRAAGPIAGGEGWQALDELIDKYAMETGIEDLAHQHDHYIHGTPKRDA